MSENDKSSRKLDYPSAELLQQSCFDNYMENLNRYERIYEKVNYSLAFCGAVLAAILSSVDVTILQNAVKEENVWRSFFHWLYLVFSTCSAIAVLCAVVQLVILLKGRTMQVFMSEAIMDNSLYINKPDDTARWLIMQYTDCVKNLRKLIADKQKQYDKTVVTVAVAVALYACSVIFMIISRCM